MSQIPPSDLLLHQQYALPKEIYGSALLPQQSDRLLKAGHSTNRDTKDIEECLVEKPCLTAFVALVLPLSREFGGPSANFIPRQTHQCSPLAYRLSGPA